MSYVEEIVKENPSGYKGLIKSRVLDKSLEMKIKQYFALENEYNQLISNAGRNGLWNNKSNVSYAYGQVGLKQSNDNWKYLGQTNDLDSCKLKAVEDRNNVYSSVVYTTGNEESDKTCYGGIKGGKTNPTNITGITTSLAPNGSSRLGGIQGENLLKQIKQKGEEIEKFIKEQQDSNVGFLKSNKLLKDERKVTGNELEKILDRLTKARLEINKVLKQPNESASAEDGYQRQLSYYIIYFYWISLVVISIGLLIHLISSDSVSVITYLFVAIWVVILAKLYYKQVEYYVGWGLDSISSVMVDSVN